MEEEDQFQNLSFDMNESRQSEMDKSNKVNIQIGNLLPAKDLLLKNHPKDEPIHFVIKKHVNQMKLQQHFFKNIQPVGEVSLDFNEDDTLGYQYKHLIPTHKLVYTRLAFNHKEAFSLMKYPIGEKGSQVIKYLSGLFINPKSIKIGSIQSINNNLYPLDYGNKQINYQPLSASGIRFIANYPSANLFYAFQVSKNQFDLIIHNDTNSRGSTQWFNFTVIFPLQQSNKQSNQTLSLYKFNIVNLTKGCDLFHKGMKILYHSSIDNKWKRLKNQYSGLLNNCVKKSDVEIEGYGIFRNWTKSYQKLTFFYRSKQSAQHSQKVIFSFFYPYSLEHSSLFWKNILIPNLVSHKPKLSQSISSNFFQVQKNIIGKTISGLPIQIYIIKDPKMIDITSKNSEGDLIKPKSLIFMARQHPGQTQGSFLIEGMVNWLMNGLKNFSTALKAFVRKNFIFHFIPMVNIEGVAAGNYRTNILGYDLNRNWRNSSLEAHPEIVNIKKYLKKINEENPISLIIDLHGHSKALNSFFYGTLKSKSGENNKIFPFLCSKNIKPISFAQSLFKVSGGKKNTARVVLSEMFPKSLVYTFQNSFYGYQGQKGKDTIVQYTPQNLRKLGKDLMSTYLEYVFLSYKKGLQKEQLEKEINIFQQKIYSNQQNPSIFSQSDSEAQIDLIDLIGVEEKQKNKNIKFSTEMSETHTRYDDLQNNKHNKIKSSNTSNRMLSPSVVVKKKCEVKKNFLKTIQLIDNSYDLTSHYLKQYSKNIENDLGPIEDTFSPLDYRGSKNATPNSFVPHSLLDESKNFCTLSARKKSTKKKKKNCDNIHFVNERQIASQKIRLRRIKGNQASVDDRTLVPERFLIAHRLINNADERGSLQYSRKFNTFEKKMLQNRNRKTQCNPINKNIQLNKF